MWVEVFRKQHYYYIGILVYVSNIFLRVLLFRRTDIEVTPACRFDQKSRHNIIILQLLINSMLSLIILKT